MGQSNPRVTWGKVDKNNTDKKNSLLISLKKIFTAEFIAKKNFSNPKPQNDRPVVFKPQTPNADFHIQWSELGVLSDHIGSS
jgi:hypothetical protein